MANPNDTNAADTTSDYLFYRDNKGWIRAFIIYGVIQAIIGLILIEFAFSRNKRIMDGNEDRDS